MTAKTKDVIEFNALQKKLGKFECCRLIASRPSEVYRISFANGFLFQRGATIVAATYKDRTYLAGKFGQKGMPMPKAMREDFAVVTDKPFGKLVWKPAEDDGVEVKLHIAF